MFLLLTCVRTMMMRARSPALAREKTVIYIYSSLFTIHGRSKMIIIKNVTEFFSKHLLSTNIHEPCPHDVSVEILSANFSKVPPIFLVLLQTKCAVVPQSNGYSKSKTNLSSTDNWTLFWLKWWGGTKSNGDPCAVVGAGLSQNCVYRTISTENKLFTMGVVKE